MSQPVLCVFSSKTKAVPLLTIDTKQPMNDVSGQPILIEGLTPILTECSKPGMVSTPIVVYRGYKGVTDYNSIFPLGMVTATEIDGSIVPEKSLKLRIAPDPKSFDWVLSSRGTEIAVAPGTVIAILGVSTGKIGQQMVRIGIYNGNSYEGWIREAYIEKFYRQY